MRRAGIAAIVVVVIGGTLVLLGFVAAGEQRHIAFTNGANDLGRGALVGEGITTCQKRLHVEESFDEVVLMIVGVRPEPRLELTVASSTSGADIARGPVPPGFAHGRGHIASPVVRLSKSVRAGHEVDVCIHSQGTRLAALFGNRHTPGDPSRAVYLPPHGAPRTAGTNIGLVFLRHRSRSVLSEIPALFRRAALFRPSFIGAWTYWVLLALVTLAVPALLVRALWSAEREAVD